MTSFYLLDHKQPSTQQWGYPRRGAKLSGTAILHTAECAMDFDGADSSAENCAAFINGRSDYGSYHVLVDSDSVIWMAPWEYETWQDSQTNPWAVGISAAVQADNWHLIPADRKDKIYRNLAVAAADFVTYMKDAYGVTVPLKRITGDQARAGVPGFCAHGDSGVDRHDPGVQFDWALFFKYTTQALGATTQEEFTVAQYEELIKQIGLAHEKENNIAKAVNDIAAKNQLFHGQSHAKLNAIKEVVDQIAKGQGVTIDWAKVEAAASAGAAKAMSENVIKVDVSVAGQAAV